MYIKSDVYRPYVKYFTEIFSQIAFPIYWMYTAGKLNYQLV